MTRFLADENTSRDLVRALMREIRGINIVRIQDAGLMGKMDPDVLEWAAAEGRVLITHDVRTVPAYAWARVRQGRPMPGVLVIPQRLPLGQVVEETKILIDYLTAEDWADQVRYLPI